MDRTLLHEMRPAGRIAYLDLLAHNWYKDGEINNRLLHHMLDRNNRIRDVKGIKKTIIKLEPKIQ